MKVALLVYSLTGNTLLIARRVSEVLRAAPGGHDVSIVPLLPAARELLSSRRNPSLPRTELAKLREAVRSAEALGVGALTWGLRAPPGLLDMLAEAGAEGTMARKSAFVFATAGNGAGLVLEELAATLSASGARVISSWSTNKAPDTYYAFMPQSSQERFRWGEDRINDCLPWAHKLRQLLDQCSSDPDSVPEEKPQVAGFVSFIKSSVPKKWTERINIDWSADKCVHCGLCETKCSSGAIVLDRGTWRVKWDADVCIACTSCVANCPAQALTVHGFDGHVFHVLKEGVSTKPGDNNWSKFGMNARMVRHSIGKNPLVPLVFAAAFAFAVYAWFF